MQRSKIGRQSKSTQNLRYKAEHRQAHNKKIRRLRTLQSQPNNSQLTLDPQQRAKFQATQRKLNLARQREIEARRVQYGAPDTPEPDQATQCA